MEIDEDALKKIEEKSHGFSPSQIFRQLKSEFSVNRIQNLSLSQIAYIWRKKNGHISGGLEKSLEYIRNSRNLNVLELENSQGIIKLYLNIDYIAFNTSFIDIKSAYAILDSTFKTNQEGFELFVWIQFVIKRW
jgi:hypothetical protein